MNKSSSFSLSLLFTGIFVITHISCTEVSPVIPEQEQIVVEAYLYADEKVDDIRLTSTVALDADTINPDPITGAQVRLWKNEKSYDLTESTAEDGFYYYPHDDLQIQNGDQFALDIVYNDQILNARTTVPEPPANVSVDNDTIEYGFPGFGGGWRRFGGSQTAEDTVINISTVRWENENDDLFYLVLKNVEEDPEPIESEFRFTFPRTFISQPTRVDSFLIRSNMNTHYGKHKITLYKINQEYADLYAERNQDSRDLNEPPTNIENGLGIFTAFNSDSLFIYVTDKTN
ncbi:MAG: DUF4249 family protein [Candidatus Marinimicrobia bacterium]|nr:DUF4249 family protein [Candidatus Neomarinimicrobiota bacterium]